MAPLSSRIFRFLRWHKGDRIRRNHPPCSDLNWAETCHVHAARDLQMIAKESTKIMPFHALWQTSGQSTIDNSEIRNPPRTFTQDLPSWLSLVPYRCHPFLADPQPSFSRVTYEALFENMGSPKPQKGGGGASGVLRGTLAVAGKRL